jgi:hypothetical protein
MSLYYLSLKQELMAIFTQYHFFILLFPLFLITEVNLISQAFVMVKQIHQFIIRKAIFEYKVVVQGLNLTVEPINEDDKTNEISVTLATTLQILSQSYLRNGLPNGDPHNLIVEFFSAKNWMVQSI